MRAVHAWASHTWGIPCLYLGLTLAVGRTMRILCTDVASKCCHSRSTLHLDHRGMKAYVWLRVPCSVLYGTNPIWLPWWSLALIITRVLSGIRFSVIIAAHATSYAQHDSAIHDSMNKLKGRYA